MKVRWGGPPTYILSRVPRKLSSWLKQMNTTASFPPSRVFQQVALVFSYVSAFHLHLARRLTFRSNRRLERRMIGWFQCTILQIILLFAARSLRSTFQRSRGIIVKRLSPFYLERLCSPQSVNPQSLCSTRSLHSLPHHSFHSFIVTRSHSFITLVALATYHCTTFRSMSFTPTSFIQYVRCTHYHV